ncbi:hypothetical protein ACLBXB_25645 [Methylobacterium mesophilicum]
MPETLTGWFLFAAMMASAVCVIVAGARLTMAELEQKSEDQQDIYYIYSFGILLALATLLFVMVEFS